jgi:hypothetical protein
MSTMQHAEITYLQRFGYYNGYAAVESPEGWFHVDQQDIRLYAQSYRWCGNFQDNFCVVQDEQGFHHINSEGKRIYKTDYAYAGDFRYGMAVVCQSNGLQSHIDTSGHYVHDQWFLGLDVFHKGIARTQDMQGWFHIDIHGKALYAERYKQVDAYYNNIAIVQKFDGSFIRIDTKGQLANSLTRPLESPMQSLSSDLVGFWKTQTIHAAVQLKILDYLPAHTKILSEKTTLKEDLCLRLLRGLQELNLVILDDTNLWQLTEKGALLVPTDSSPMAAATRMWGDSHYKRWMNLPDTLIEQNTDTHQYFESLSKNIAEISNYQQALSGYALLDYAKITEVIDWRAHRTVIDMGGGTGTLLHLILNHYPHLQGMLLEKPAVIDLIVPLQLHPHGRYIGMDFREKWAHSADAIILARILHDWSDEEAVIILRQAVSNLQANGRIYLLEMLLPEHNGQGGLLDLNMLVMTGGRERTLRNEPEITSHYQAA